MCLAGVVGSRAADGADVIGYGLVIRSVVDDDNNIAIPEICRFTVLHMRHLMLF